MAKPKRFDIEAAHVDHTLPETEMLRPAEIVLNKLWEVHPFGVARTSYGLSPYVVSTTVFTERFKEALED